MNNILMLLFYLFGCIYSYGQSVNKISKGEISLEYPFDWNAKEAPGYLMILSEPAGTELSVITTFDIQSDTTKFKKPDEFLTSYIEIMSKNPVYKDLKVLSKVSLIYKGYNAIEYHCTATVQYFPVEWKSVIFIKDGRFYKLSTTSLVGVFEINKEKTEAIFESVIIN